MLANLTNLFAFLGGLGMFLYGMHIMADGMQKTAGGKMQKFLAALTNNKLMAVGLGAVVTAIIQSSGATTVMVVGFVSAGVMNLTQAVGVIMGANIGTTITAWIVSLSQLGDAFDLMRPEFYAPLLVGLGALVYSFSGSNRKKMTGEIVLGLGFLFLGLKTMSSGIKPYTDLPIFSTSFALLGGNPILGILVGAIVTALLQSSSASVGILQTLALNGVVTKSSAVYITLGQNIGSCVTALISSTGAPKIAKRAAIIHLLFNMFGAVIFGVVGFIYFSINKNFAMSNINSVQISIFHTVFNLIMTSLLLPFPQILIKLSGMIIKEDKEGVENMNDMPKLKLELDERILEAPALALEFAMNEVIKTGEIAGANVRLAVEALLEKDIKKVEKVKEIEKSINEMQTILTEYLMKLDALSLGDKQKMVLTNLYYSVSDIERVGDHADNIAENAESLMNRETDFTQVAKEELLKISESALKAFDLAIEARRTGRIPLVQEVNKLEIEVDFLEDELREKHISRLVKGECKPEAGIIFLDVISNLERISDHATNLAEYLMKEL